MRNTNSYGIIRRREISESDRKRVLNIAERVMIDMGYPPKKISPNLRGWSDRRGLFHTCGITFLVTYEYVDRTAKILINIYYCRHLEKIFVRFATRIVDVGILKS